MAACTTGFDIRSERLPGMPPTVKDVVDNIDCELRLTMYDHRDGL